MSREKNVEALARHTPYTALPYGERVIRTFCSCGHWSEGASSWAAHLASVGIGSADALTDEEAAGMGNINPSPLPGEHMSEQVVSRSVRAALARAFGKDEPNADD